MGLYFLLNRKEIQIQPHHFGMQAQLGVYMDIGIQVVMIFLADRLERGERAPMASRGIGS